MNRGHFQSLLTKYRSKGTLIDANLLLLYFVGCYDPQLIPRFKRTKIFTIDDFPIIERIFDYFDFVVTTPNILTEVSNLSNQLTGKTKQGYFEEFGRRLVVLEEKYSPSSLASEDPYFTSCGLTDSGVIRISAKEYLVITDDFRLSNILHSLGVDVINFNHLRVLGG